MSFVSRVLDRFTSGSRSDPERDKAIIDLLELMMLVDRSSTEAERAAILTFIERCDWEDGGGPDSYSQQATARARLAIELPDEMEALLTSVSTRLTDAADRAAAVDAVAELAHADGVLDPSEQRLLDGLRARLGAA